MHPIFAADTLEGLDSATVEAQRRADAGEPAGIEALRSCRLAREAVLESGAGRIEAARALVDRAVEGCADERLLYLGFQFHFRAGDRGRAEAITRRRLEVAPPGSREEARAWGNLGLIRHFRGELDEAQRLIRRALEINTRLGHERGVARDLGNLALIPEALGDLPEAERLTREALLIAERLGLAGLIAGFLCNLGEMVAAQGRHGEARGLLVRAQRLFGELGDAKHEALCAGNLRKLGGAG